MQGSVSCKVKERCLAKFEQTIARGKLKKTKDFCSKNTAKKGESNSRSINLFYMYYVVKHSVYGYFHIFINLHIVHSSLSLAKLAKNLTVNIFYLQL